jgi:hypothetical protein
VHARRHDRDGVTGLLEEPALQSHRDLSTAEGLEVLIAEHHDVHGAYSGICSPR